MYAPVFELRASPSESKRCATSALSLSSGMPSTATASPSSTVRSSPRRSPRTSGNLARICRAHSAAVLPRSSSSRCAMRPPPRRPRRSSEAESRSESLEDAPLELPLLDDAFRSFRLFLSFLSSLCFLPFLSFLLFLSLLFLSLLFLSFLDFLEDLDARRASSSAALSDSRW